MTEKEDTFAMTDAMVRVLLQRKKPSQPQVTELTYKLINGDEVRTTAQYIDDRWGPVEVPADVDVRELMMWPEDWAQGRPPESVLATTLNLADQDLLNLGNSSMGPIRWAGVIGLTNTVAKALHGDIEYQSLQEAFNTVVELAALLKPGFKMKLSTVQSALVAVAHDFRYEDEPPSWFTWLDKVNVYLTKWKKNPIAMEELRDEVADFKKRGFIVVDHGKDLEIPKSMIVVSVEGMKRRAAGLLAL